MPGRASVLALLMAVSSSAWCAEALPAGLLDFLGMMVESDGELIDPMVLETSADEALLGAEPVSERHVQRPAPNNPDAVSIDGAPAEAASVEDEMEAYDHD